MEASTRLYESVEQVEGDFVRSLTFKCIPKINFKFTSHVKSKSDLRADWHRFYLSTSHSMSDADSILTSFSLAQHR